MRLVKLLPMAITAVDCEKFCVAAITEDNIWIRPGPIKKKYIFSDKPAFSYLFYSRLHLDKDNSSDARLEDHHIVSDIVSADLVEQKNKQEILKRNLSNNIDSCFKSNSSVALIEVDINKIYYKKTTGGKQFLRIKFYDGNTIEDWITPELDFTSIISKFKTQDESLFLEAINILKQCEVYFTIALTKPNNRFPGKFAGCHPLIVGIHTFPDYKDSLKQRIGI